MSSLPLDSSFWLCDRASGCVRCRQLKREDSANLILTLNQLFQEDGHPSILEMDGASYFTLTYFQNYIKEMIFVHKKLSPYFPSLNGLSERSICMLKNIWLKTRQLKQDFQRGIAAFNDAERTDH